MNYDWTKVFSVIVSILAVGYLALKLIGRDLKTARELEKESANSISERYSAYKLLFGSLLFLFLDYIEKLYHFARNLPYFPIGLDHRTFKRKIAKLSYDSGEIKLHEEPNEFYVGFRPMYGLICLATYSIGIWIFHSLSNTFAPFIPDQRKLLLYCLITSCAVFLCDVAVIRTLIAYTVRRTVGVPTKNDVAAIERGWKNYLLNILPSKQLFFGTSLFLYRALIVLATGVLLSFSLSVPLVVNSLNKELKAQKQAEINDSNFMKETLKERRRLVNEIYQLDARNYCASFSLSGPRGRSLIYSADQYKQAEERVPFPGEILQRLLSEGAPQGVDCSQYLIANEAPCISSAVTERCPNAYRQARSVYLDEPPRDSWRPFGLSSHH